MCYFKGVEDEEDLNLYISEDQDTEVQHTRKTTQQIQTSIMQDLRQVLGVDASLPENVAKELILQVISEVPLFFS